MSSKADQQTSVQAISHRFPERRPPNFDIVKPLAKSKGAGTEDLILFFRWLGVFYLLAGRCQWHGAKFCMGQLKFHLICLVKNMSKNYRTNLCASLEDWLVWWMCTQSRKLLHKEGTKESKPPESCCHSNYRYLHQRLLSIVSLFSKSNIYFWIDLKSVISSTAWAHQAASV